MLSERIIALVREYNPWFEGRGIVVPEYKRRIFGNIEKYLNTKQIIAIVGLRRVGKTVLMKQLIKELLEKKENVFYFLFDELLAQSPAVLEDIINYYLKNIAREGRKYIFLDEIQKVPYWQDIVKRFYENREEVKFVVSGSSSLEIKKTKESLAGRIYDFYMPVLEFVEFLELNGIKTEKILLEHAREAYEKSLHKKTIFEHMFLQYVLKGAFPEIAREEDEEIIKKYIKSSVIEKIIFEDIPAVFGVKREDVLFSLLEYCCKETSSLLDITNLSKILSANYQTTKAYLFYLKNSFLIDLLYNYSKSISRQLRKNKKVHVVHPSVAIAMLSYSKNILNVSEIMGKYAESLVFQYSKTERTFFWRTPQKEEVDLILNDEKMLPIEVKYQSKITTQDTAYIIKFMKKFNAKKGIIVSKDLFEEREIDEKILMVIPAWLFLLIEF